MAEYSRKVAIEGKGAAEIYEAVSQGLADFLEKTGVGHVDLTPNAEDRTVEVRSKLISAVLTCTDGGVEISGKLSMFAAPFRSKIDEGIDRWLKREFGEG